MELDIRNDNREYKEKAICNSAICGKKSELSYLPKLYYPVSWKDYLKEKNT